VTNVLDEAFPTRAPVNVVLVTAGTLRRPDRGTKVNRVAVRSVSFAPAEESRLPNVIYRVELATSR
jgi:hypothetical protein